MEIVGDSVELSKRCRLSSAINSMWRLNSSSELTNNTRYQPFTARKYNRTANCPLTRNWVTNSARVWFNAIIRPPLREGPAPAPPCRPRNDRHPSARGAGKAFPRSEEHTSELQSRRDLVCRL